MNSNRLQRNLNTYGLFAITFLIAMVQSSTAYADTIGDSIVSFGESLLNIPTLVSTIAFALGAGFMAYSLPKFKQHVDNPTQIPLSDPVKMMIAAAMFLAMPAFTGVVLKTFGLDGADSLTFSSDLADGAVSDSGLDGMFYNLSADFVSPMLGLISIFCYIAGCFVLLTAIHRITKGFNEGARGPVGAGTAMHFVVAAVLFAAPDVLGVLSETIFGSSKIFVNATIDADLGMDGALKERAEAVFNAVISFMILIGIISFVRGWFIMKSVADGNSQASMMAAFTHIIAGVLAVNIGPFMNAVQATFNISGSGISFG